MIFGPTAQLKILESTLRVDYAANGELLFRKDGSRSTSPLAQAFWKGCDESQPNLIPPGTMIHAAYKAGCACRKLH